MKHKTAGMIFLFVLATTTLHAFDIGTEFFIGNMAFADTRTSTETTLPAVFPWGGSVIAHQQVNDDISLDIGFYADPTLHLISYTLLNYQLPFFSISVGPLFGLFNSRNTILKPGISTAIRADIPGLAFVSFRADSSIGGRLVQSGDYLQERSDISLGFYVPNAIASVNLLTRSYIYRTDAEEIVDSYLEYSFKTDLFQKNVPYRVLLSFGYQERGKSFINVTSREAIVHRLSSIVLGTNIGMQLTSWLLLELNLDSSIYSFGDAGDELLALPSTGIAQYLFNASIGARVQVDALLNRNPYP